MLRAYLIFGGNRAPYHECLEFFDNKSYDAKHTACWTPRNALSIVSPLAQHFCNGPWDGWKRLNYCYTVRRPCLSDCVELYFHRCQYYAAEQSYLSIHFLHVPETKERAQYYPQTDPASPIIDEHIL